MAQFILTNMRMAGGPGWALNERAPTFYPGADPVRELMERAIKELPIDEGPLRAGEGMGGTGADPESPRFFRRSWVVLPRFTGAVTLIWGPIEGDGGRREGILDQLFHYPCQI
jgi:hypothetical protein